MFLSDSVPLTRTFTMSILSFILLVFVLRISGKRTLSKMNSFDFIVTIALGSVMANTVTSTGLPLVNGILAFSILVFMQYLTSWLVVRSDFFLSLTKSQPVMLYYNGRFDEILLKKERITKVEILQAVRQEGKSSLDEVIAVVLETDGTLSLIDSQVPKSEDDSGLSNVRNKDLGRSD